MGVAETLIEFATVVVELCGIRRRDAALSEHDRWEKRRKAAADAHLRQVDRTEAKLIAGLTPLFVHKVESMSRRLAALGGKIGQEHVCSIWFGGCNGMSTQYFLKIESLESEVVDLEVVA